MQIKRHPNGRYYAHFESASGPVQLSLKTKAKAEAIRLAREAKLENIERLAKANALTQEAITRAVAGRRVTGASALPVWQSWADSVGLQPTTREQYRLLIAAFLRDMGLENKPVSTLGVPLLNEWVNQAVTLATRMSRMKAMKSFCSVLTANGLVSGAPSMGIRIRYHDLTHEQKEATERQPFTPEEVRTLLRGLPQDWAAMSALALSTGFRLADCASIERACFLDNHQAVALWMGKVDRRIALPLPALAREHLKKLDSNHPRFIFPRFAELANDIRRRSYLSTYFKREASKLGVKGKSFHCFRHTFATEHAKRGATVDEIRLKLGHELSDTTLRYVHVE